MTGMLKKGLMLASAAMAAATIVGVGQASAAASDTVQAPTANFVPTDAQKYDFPYYRYGSGDWGWTHGGIGGSFSSATLNISAFDVDYASGELDAIYAYDDGVKTFLGYLTGSNDTWEYGNAFSLGSNFFNDIAAGLQVFVDIDSTDAGWALTLGKSVLSVDGGRLPPPTPGGVPEPGAWALMLMGVAGLGAALRQRRSAAALV